MALGDFLEKKSNIIVVLLLLVLFLQAITSIKNKSMTVDEISHLASGYSYIKTGDFRLNVESPPLIDMISASPLLFLDPKLPLDHESWILAEENEFEGQYHWEFGEQFFYHYGNDADKMLFFGRIPMILLSMLLGFYVFKFAKELFGVKAGLFSLFLYSFSPNLLAHSRLATTDLGISCFMFIAVYYFWRFIKDGSTRALVFAGVTFGLAQLSKFTALYLIPIYTLLTIIVIISKKKLETPIHGALFLSKRSLKLYGKVFLIGIIGLFVISIGYFFWFWKYFDGIAYALLHGSAGHPVYLLGMHSTAGWWYYYIVAFFVKTPLAALLLILLSGVFFKQLRHEDGLNDVFLILPPVFFFSMFFFSYINIGLRYVLPIYPFVFVCLGRLVNLKKIKWVLVILGVGYMLSSVMIYPNYLAYFNEVVGPENGYNYLADSNIDWGQDLKGLKLWIDDNNVKTIRLGYWGKETPEFRDIDYEQINCYPEKGLLAISANNLIGLTEEKRACIKWIKDYEPIDNIGHSILIYDIPEVDSKDYAKNFCKDECKRRCEDSDLNYGQSDFVNETCECSCLE